MDRTTFRDDIEIMLFHGTTSDHEESFREQIRIFEPQRKTIRDFGTGFYTTTFYWQAVRYANSMAKLASLTPMVVCCSTTLGAIRNFNNVKIIDDYDLDWMETIRQGRWSGEKLIFDWIYGRVGDGRRTIQRVYEQGASSEALLEHAVPRRDNPFYYYDQLWFGTNDSVGILTLQSIIKPRGEESTHAAATSVS